MVDRFKEQGYITGDSKRIFLNTSLGCQASCKYCYLPELGYETGVTCQRTISYKYLIEELLQKNLVIRGVMGSIISLGCFSECWDSVNLEETKGIVKYFLETGNPVQIATKRFVDYKELAKIKEMIQWYGQLTFFISCSTVKHWRAYEAGTDPPFKRFKSFKNTNKANIPAYLYIKPVIQDVTIQDKTTFADIMYKYDIETVIGRMFTSKNVSNYIAPIGEGHLFYSKETDEEAIKSALSYAGKTYKRSIEPILERRDNHARQRIDNARK